MDLGFNMCCGQYIIHEADQDEGSYADIAPFATTANLCICTVYSYGQGVYMSSGTQANAGLHLNGLFNCAKNELHASISTNKCKQRTRLVCLAAHFTWFASESLLPKFKSQCAICIALNEKHAAQRGITK